MFTHRLALALGKTVGELSATMGSSEFSDWLKYYEVEPWGAVRDNLHAGQIASTLVKLFGSKRRKAPEAADFVLRPLRARKNEETNRSLSWLRAVAKRK